jgi:KaiC/GvpD/RAD55 family RecA-like ATPase
VTRSDRARLGVTGLDEMLRGGLMRESVCLVSGSPGTGKSTLATQFIIEGIANGENGAYISLEEEKHGFFRNMRPFGWDLAALEGEGRLYFEFFRTEELVRNITDGYQTIDHELRKIRAKRLVIDSVTAYLLASNTELARRNETKRLFDDLRKWRVTSILTGEGRASEAAYGVDYLVDSIIRLQNRPCDQRPGLRQRLVEVEKMRGSQHSQELKPMEIGAEGIKVG